jgi:hypothetical protein
MNLIKHQEIEEISNRVKQGMIDFISEDTSYSEEEVGICMNILKKHLDELSKTKNKNEGMALVEKTVLQLNELNEKCEYELIETGQREDICEILILAGNEMGYNDRGEDITEEWREW